MPVPDEWTVFILTFKALTMSLTMKLKILLDDTPGLLSAIERRREDVYFELPFNPTGHIMEHPTLDLFYSPLVLEISLYRAKEDRLCILFHRIASQSEIKLL